MRGLTAIGCWLGLVPAALACGNVDGIPADCRMHTKAVTVPGVGEVAAQDALRVEDLATVRMHDRWTVRPHVLSPDGETLIVHRADGFLVLAGGEQTFVEADLRAHTPRGFCWSPDSTRVAYWAPGPGKRIALLDLRRPREQWEPQLVYDPRSAAVYTGHGLMPDPLLHQPFGLAWSPDGAALLVGEFLYDERDQMRESSLARLDLDAGGVTSIVEVVRTPELIDFFQPLPATESKPLAPSLLYGVHSGLYVARLDGITEPRRLRQTPSTGVWSLACDPSSSKFSLHFRRPGVDRHGREYAGLWQLDPARSRAPERALIDDRPSIRLLDYSPSGTYLTWATPEELCYRRPEAPRAETVYLDTRTPGSEDFAEIHAFAWHSSEDVLAYTAGSELYLHEIRSGATRRIKAFSDDRRDFVAGLSWAGDRLILTLFEDMTPPVERACYEPRPR